MRTENFVKHLRWNVWRKKLQAAIFAKHFTLDVWTEFEYASAFGNCETFFGFHGNFMF